MACDCMRNKLLLEFSAIRKLFFHMMLKFWRKAVVFLFGQRFFKNCWCYWKMFIVDGIFYRVQFQTPLINVNVYISGHFLLCPYILKTVTALIGSLLYYILVSSAGFSFAGYRDKQFQTNIVRFLNFCNWRKGRHRFFL